jgi:hypothetical protein
MFHVRTFAVFTLLLSSCDTDVAPLPVSTPDPAAAMSLRAELPAIELAGGELVALDLTDEQQASLECAGDPRISQLWIGPLQLGERELAAPVLEVACDGEHAQPQLSLRETGAPSVRDELPLRAPEPMPVNTCDWAGTTVCVPCGGIGMRTRTTVVTNYNPYTNHCTYGYTYGGCSVNAC